MVNLFFKKIIILGISILIGIVLLEAALRLTNGPNRINIVKFDERTYTANRPNVEGYVRTDEFYFNVKINSLGLRDYERYYEKNKSLNRIYFAGDSFTFGEGVELEQTFVKIIEKKLENVETINTGVPGWDTTQELIFLKENGFKYKADTIVLVIFLNDIPANIRGLYYIENGSLIRNYTFIGKIPLTYKIRSYLSAKSYLYKTFSERINRQNKLIKLFINEGEPKPIEISSQYEIFTNLENNKTKTYWEKTEMLIIEMRDFVEKKLGKNFITVIIPYQEQVYSNQQYKIQEYADSNNYKIDIHKPQEKLTKILTKEDIEYIDLLPYFKENNNTQLYFSYDGHMNAKGHNLTAEILIKFFELEEIV